MKFSIIAPVYKTEAYIEKCVKSVLNQSFSDFEFLIIDDGTPDQSIAIAESITKGDKRVSILHKKNGGLSDARNYGLAHAKGDFILFLDSDDYLREDALEKLSPLTEDNCDIILFGYTEVKQGKEIPNPIDYPELTADKRYVLAHPSAWQRCYRRKFLLDNQQEFTIGKYYEDLGFTAGLAKFTKKIKILDDCLYYYLIRSNSIMTSKDFNPKKDDRFWALDQIREKLHNEYATEIEFTTIKQLIIMYSLDIFTCSKSIYQPRLKRVKEYLAKYYPNYLNNPYLKEDSLPTRIFVRLYHDERYGLCKLIAKLYRI